MALVRHLVVLRFKEGFTDEQNRNNAQKMKTELEALKGRIPGIVDFCVHIDALPTSNMDVVINSTFTSEEALAAYQIHPEHVKASEFVRSFMRDRACIDYYEDDESGR